MPKFQQEIMKHMKNQKNMAHWKQPNNSLESDPEEIQPCDLLEGNFNNNYLRYAQWAKGEQTTKRNPENDI